jgi:arsenical pump membrane protein
VSVALLAAGVLTMFLRPRGMPLWAGPLAAAAVGLAVGAISLDATRDALDALRDPLAFLALAVPLAILLDHLGVFAALAGRSDHGEHLLLWLWLLGIGVVIVFNLDAAVVLLTPLYIRIAQRHGIDPIVLAFQPALLACLASHPLPVSNLTNLVAAERLDLDVTGFLVHLGPMTVVACTVGWFGYDRWVLRHTSRNASTHDLTGAPVVPAGDDARALRLGLPIIGFVLVGFTVGNTLGVPAWIVAAIAALWAMALVREVPWRTIPIGAILVAAALAVLVAGALPHLHVDRLLDAGGMPGRLRAFGFGAFGSDATNNLPTILAGSASLHEPSQVWALLAGTNLAPILVISGSLSGLLWRDTAKRFGVHISARRYTEVGLRVGLLAVLLGGLTVVLLG